MLEKILDAKLANFGENVHAHKWRIEEASGPTSLGTCKDCGRKREFRNWLPEGDFITNEEHRVYSEIG